MTESALKRASTFGRSAALRTVVPSLCTVALLCGIYGDRMVRRQPDADAAPYHRRVRTSVDAVPFQFGNWLGVDVPVPQGAVQMLKPNAVISRRYEEMGTGRRITVLLVQCTDARDILGHYPPVCYAGQGWQLMSAEPRDWTVDGLSVRGTRYVFRGAQRGLSGEITIDNFMVLPNGATARNMDEVEVAAQDQRRKFFGAAQVQLVYDSNLPESDRKELFADFLHVLHPVINAVERRQGENPS